MEGGGQLGCSGRPAVGVRRAQLSPACPEASRGPRAWAGHLEQKHAAAKGTGAPSQRPGPT